MYGPSVYGRIRITKAKNHRTRSMRRIRRFAYIPNHLFACRIGVPHSDNPEVTTAGLRDTKYRDIKVL